VRTAISMGSIGVWCSGISMALNMALCAGSSGIVAIPFSTIVCTMRVDQSLSAVSRAEGCALHLPLQLCCMLLIWNRCCEDVTNGETSGQGGWCTMPFTRYACA